MRVPSCYAEIPGAAVWFEQAQKQAGLNYEALLYAAGDAAGGWDKLSLAQQEEYVAGARQVLLRGEWQTS